MLLKLKKCSCGLSYSRIQVLVDFWDVIESHKETLPRHSHTVMEDIYHCVWEQVSGVTYSVGEIMSE